MSNGNGHHWSKFCWRDWSADKALHPCSLGAKGFWIEMLCIMHDGTPVGHLTLGGKPATIRQMAANAFCSEKEAKKYLAELEEAGVFSRAPDGTIYSRRMVKDAAASEAGREHIAKRWRAQEPNSPPNRVPTSKPNGVGHSPPITKSQNPESETEREREERKEVIKNSSFSQNARAQGGGRQETVPDGLDALLSEAGIEPPSDSDPRGKCDLPERFAVHVRRVAKACEMKIPYGEVRSVEAQLAAIQTHPQVVGSDETMGLKWQPAEPVRSVEEQRAALLASCTAEQIAKAQRHMARAS